MLFSLDWISGITVGIEFVFPDEFTNGAAVINLGIV